MNARETTVLYLWMLNKLTDAEKKTINSMNPDVLKGTWFDSGNIIESYILNILNILNADRVIQDQVLQKVVSGRK